LERPTEKGSPCSIFSVGRGEEEAYYPFQVKRKELYAGGQVSFFRTKGKYCGPFKSPLRSGGKEEKIIGAPLEKKRGFKREEKERRFFLLLGGGGGGVFGSWLGGKKGLNAGFFSASVEGGIPRPKERLKRKRLSLMQEGKNFKPLPPSILGGGTEVSQV